MSNFIPTYNIQKLAFKLGAATGYEHSVVVNITEIAGHLGYSIFEAEFSSDTIAAYLVSNKQEKSIYVNLNDPEEVKRFEIAHSVGHIVLHYANFKGDFEEVDIRKTEYYKTREKQANIFAASLLMPEDMTKEIWDTFRNVNDFARTFVISKKAAIIRLDELGLI